MQLAEIEVTALVWDEANEARVLAHGLKPEVVEAVLLNHPRFFRNLPGRSAEHVMLGPDRDGRFVFVPIVPSTTQGHWYVVTAFRLGSRRPGASMIEEAEPMKESTEEIANRYEEAMAKGTEAEGLVPVKARVKANADIVYSSRFSRDEIAVVREAAARHRMAPSAFIRRAALAAAADALDLDAADRAMALQEVKTRAKELAEAAGRL